MRTDGGGDSTTTGPAPASALDRSALAPSRWYRPALLRWANALLAIASVVYLGYKFWQLLFGADELDAIDLLLRHDEVRAWFAGERIYWQPNSAIYPPASYVMLWPILGWSPNEHVVRLAWAALCAGTLALLVLVTVRESGVDRREERRFAALVPLALYATGGAIGNGQLTVPLVLLLALMPRLLSRARAAPTLGNDLRLAGAALVSLAKPTLAAPFFWLVLAVPGRLRPATLVVTGYAGLTLFAAAFQPDGPAALIARWVKRSVRGVAVGADRDGFGSISDALPLVDLPSMSSEVSLALLALFGLWVWRHRTADPWLLAGVAAIISRIWIYHAWYDDLLLLLPLIALFRLAKGVAGVRAVEPAAGLLVGLLVAAMIAPGGHYLLPEPLRSLYATALVGLWLWTLSFLALRARRPRPAS